MTFVFTLNGVALPASTKHMYNICTMLDQRQRRRADVVQMLYKCFMFAALVSPVAGKRS